MEHLSSDDYISALKDEFPFYLLYRRVHEHLVRICETCGEAWDAGQGRGLQVPELPEDQRAYSHAHLRAMKDLLSWARAERREAREDLESLLELPIEEWPGRVERARSRLRSGVFAELLIEEARSRALTAPEEAMSLCELVTPALDRHVGRLDLPWAKVLLLRAEAHRANTLRILGDLPAARTVFVEIRQRMVATVTLPSEIEAEIHSLEASLAIDARDFRAAERLLGAAAEAYEVAGVPLGLVRTLIQRANLHQTQGQPEMISPLMERAASLFDSEEEPFLYFCTVQGRINAFLDLNQPGAAQAVLDAERSAYLESGDPYGVAIHGFQTARVALGVGEHDAAVAGFATAREDLLELDRDYDAILASLYQADALLAAGRCREARELATELVPMFQARGVARETLGALRLLAEAAAAETLTSAVVETVRRRLDGSATAG